MFEKSPCSSQLFASSYLFLRKTISYRPSVNLAVFIRNASHRAAHLLVRKMSHFSVTFGQRAFFALLEDLRLSNSKLGCQFRWLKLTRYKAEYRPGRTAVFGDPGRYLKACFCYHALSAFLSSSSPQMLTESALALSSFEPAASPATTAKVFFDTDPETLPPAASMSA